MKHLICIVSLLSLTFFVVAQKFQFSYFAGYGSYKLDDLKNLQQEISENTNLPTIKIIEDFPSYFNHTIQIEYQGFKWISFGLNGSYLYTGARSHYQDYSGEYKLDFQLHAYKVGINIKSQPVCLIPVKNLNWFAQLKIGRVFSNMKIDELLDIFEVDNFQQNLDFNSKNIYIEPALGFSYNIFNFLSVSIYTGYEFDFPKPLYFEDDKDEFLLFRNRDKVKADWSGFRPALGIGLSF